MKDLARTKQELIEEISILKQKTKKLEKSEAKRKQTEDERKAHICFLESMERVDQTIKQETDVEQMLRNILETVLSIFDCDRAWLFYPCDPDAPTFRVPMEICRPEYPGAKVLNMDVLMPPDMAQNLREVLESADPVVYIAGTEKPINKVTAEQFGVQSQMFVALYPKLGRPWVFGMHQCSYPRSWTNEDKNLFKEISRRISDGLSSVLFLRELQENEEKYRIVADNTYDWEFWMSPEEQFLYISPSCLRITGYEAKQFLANPDMIKEIVLSEDRALFEHHWHERESNQLPPGELIFRIVHKDGSERWIHHVCQPVFNAGGIFMGRRGSNRDITDRKLMEEKLQFRNILLSTQQEASIDGILVVDENNRILLYNRRFVEMMGIPAKLVEARVDEPVLQFVTARMADPQSFLQRVQYLYEHRQETGRDELILADGRFFDRYSAPMIGSDKRYFGRVWYFRDITEHKRVAAVVAENERKFSTLIGNLPGMAYRCVNDREWTMSFLSERCRDLTGYAPEEIIDNRRISYNDVVNFEHRERIWNEVQTALSKKEQYSFEYSITTATGDVKWAWERGCGIFSPDGEVQALEGFISDVTERKRAEVEIAGVNRALRMLSDTNQALIHIADEATLLNEVCRIAVEVGGYRLAWIGFTEHDEVKTLRPLAHAGFDSGYIESAKVTWADNERGRGPGGTAIRTGRPCMARNIPEDTAFAPWREAAIQRGYKSIIALPLISEGQTLGVLGIYSVDTDAFDTKEVEILEEMGNDLAFGITALRTRVKRDQTAVALHESEERYRLIAEKTADTIAVFDLNLNPTYFSPSILKLRGYTVEEAMIQTLNQTLTPDSLQRASKMFADQMALESNETADPARTALIELEEYCKDGSTIWVELAASFLRDNNFKPTGILTVTRNITDRKEAEEALRNSEGRLRTLVQTIPDLIWLKDPNGVYLSCNTMFERFFGASEAAIVGKTDYDFVDRELADSFREHDRKAMAAGKPTSNEEWITFADDGHRALLDTIKTPMCDDQGMLIGVLGIGRDTTDRKQAEEAIRDGERLVHTIIDGSPIPAFVIGKNHQVIHWNRALEKVSRVKSEEVVGTSEHWRAFYTEGRPCMADLLVDEAVALIPHWYSGKYIKPPLIEGAYEATDFFPALGEDGKWLRFTAAAVRDSKGRIVAAIETLEDITERKHMENQLFQSQKMEAIGTLAGGIAHDFNNILAVIIGYTELAMHENQKEKQIWCLQETLKGAERAKSLVKQILTFSRRDDHEKKPLDIKLLLKEAVKFLRASIPTTIEINQHVTDESCNIMADPTQIHQIIMNLFTNAAHAMKQAGGILKIELATIELDKGEIPRHPDLKPGHYVKLTVSDTGHGIDPDNIQRIFDPFFTTKSKDEGTGLGLSVVYGIVKSHAGVINVYSEPDKGATFNVYLPRIIHSDTMKVDTDKPVTGGTERILFVDDEPALVDMGTRMLVSLGYNTTGAAGSVEALDLFRAEPQRFDLVITDMTLPKMTGIELSREILKIRPGTPIVLCSGIREHGTEEQAKSLGIKAYCMKPLTKRELARVVRDTLDGYEKTLS